MSGVIPENHDKTDAWHVKWHEKFSKSWRVANDGKYYPRKPVQVERKDIDDVIATVR